MKKNFLASAALVAAGLLVLSACSAPAEEDAPAQDTAAPAVSNELTGDIIIDGSSTVGPFATVAAELFMELNPGVRITVSESGTGGGFEKFCNGETDGQNASRDIKDEEAANCETNGVAFTRLTVANDALSVVVNVDNPIDCISVEALNAIWKLDSTVRTWGDVPGVDAGELASTAVKLYGPGIDSGTFDFFTEEINGEGGNIIQDPPYESIGEDDNLAVVGVSGNQAAMAFIPFSYYQVAAEKGEVKGLSIDNGSGCVEPSFENVLNGTYTPLGRSLFMFPKGEALTRPEVVAFYTFVIENNEEIAQLAEFIPLTAEQREEQLAAVAALLGS